MQTINGVKIHDVEAAENYAINKMGKDAHRRFGDIAYSQWFNSLKAEYSSLHLGDTNINAPLPHEARLKMIERSQIYSDPAIYQYGYYDGYQLANATTQALSKSHAELLNIAKMYIENTDKHPDFKMTKESTITHYFRTAIENANKLLTQ